MRAFGIDVSRYQGDVVWSQVKAAGYSFGFVKATEGAAGVDPWFAANWQEAKVEGVLRGAYHFFRPARDPIKQADHFMSTVVRAGGKGELPAVIDVEVTDGLPKQKQINALEKMVKRLQANGWQRLIIYTSPYFWNTNYGRGTNVDNDADLWVAHWWVSWLWPRIVGGAFSPTLPINWQRRGWKFWQYGVSPVGYVPGVIGRCDLNVFNGDIPALIRYAT